MLDSIRDRLRPDSKIPRLSSRPFLPKKDAPPM
jgi:hypothetical protein